LPILLGSYFVPYPAFNRVYHFHALINWYYREV
jgi:hypothetical protein